jgi:drug/metabolite transporter (DMT)-like permease
VLFAALSLLWGIPYLMIRVAVEVYDPVVVAFGRTALGGLLLLPLALARHQLMPVLRRWRHLLLYTLVEIVGPWWLLGHAETRLDSSTAGLLVAMVPLLTAVLLVITGRDRFGVRRIAGLVIGFGGVACLVGIDLDLHDLGAVAAVVGTVVGYSFGAYMMAHLLGDLPPIGVVTGSLLLAATIYLPFAIWLHPDHVTATATWSVIGLAVLCTALAFLCIFALIAEAGPGRATVITYVNPAIAIVLGILVLDEPFTVGVAIGFPLVIIGALLATSRSGTSRSAPDDLPPLAGPTGTPGSAAPDIGSPECAEPRGVRPDPAAGTSEASRPASADAQPARER